VPPRARAEATGIVQESCRTPWRRMAFRSCEERVEPLEVRSEEQGSWNSTTPRRGPRGIRLSMKSRTEHSEARHVGHALCILNENLKLSQGVGQD
jgi:hypothetical protein